jgi:hypothetical protein
MMEGEEKEMLAGTDDGEGGAKERWAGEVEEGGFALGEEGADAGITSAVMIG